MSEDRDRTARTSASDGYTALPAGTRLLDRFIVESVLGTGGFGITYLGRDDVFGIEVAIKELFPRQFAYRHDATKEIRTTDAKTFAWALERFKQEARTLHICEHPNVVRVTNYFEANGTGYMVLEYVPGRSLKAWLDGLGRRPTQAEMDRILEPLLEALAYVHGKGILHRDLKPDNIIIRPDGRPCLIDFGAARLAIAGHTQTLTGIVSPDYSPPEQHDPSGRGQSEASDIYSLGATLYRALAGRSPPGAMLRAAHDDMRPLSEVLAEPAASPGPPADRPRHGSEYRAAFLSAIDAALAVRIADRPQSVAAWRAKLIETPPPLVAVPPRPNPVGDARVPAAGTAARASGREAHAVHSVAPAATATVGGQPAAERHLRAWATGALALLVGLAAAGYWLLADRAKMPERRDVVIAAAPQARPEAAQSAERARLAEEAARQRAAAERVAAAAETKSQRQAVVPSPIPPAAARDPIAALTPGSGQSARDRLADGGPCPFCPEMVVVPAGEFLMGSPNGEPGRDIDEGSARLVSEPRVRVGFARPFAIGRFEVTWTQWEACVAERACEAVADLGWGRGDRPVIHVSWQDAQAFSGWLARRTGQSYRLPTEPEWEYAARAGTQTAYSWGDEFDPSRVQILARQTSPVGRFKANAFGLHDVHGNVAEWVDDCWFANLAVFQRSGSSAFTTCPDSSRRSVRGGSWSASPAFLRSARREWANADKRANDVGFRLARTLGE